MPSDLRAVRAAGGNVLIRAFLGHQSFDCKTLDQMNDVFLHTCNALGLAPAKDPATEVVANKVIELGGLGTRNAGQLRRAVQRAFNLAR